MSYSICNSVHKRVLQAEEGVGEPKHNLTFTACVTPSGQMALAIAAVREATPLDLRCSAAHLQADLLYNSRVV